MRKKEGTQGPWRRGANCYCRLSRQPLVRYGSTVACVSLFVSFVALVSMGLKFLTVPTSEVLLTKAGSLPRVFGSLGTLQATCSPDGAPLLTVLRCRVARDTKPTVDPYPSVGNFTCGLRTSQLVEVSFTSELLRISVCSSHTAELLGGSCGRCSSSAKSSGTLSSAMFRTGSSPGIVNVVVPFKSERSRCY